MAQLSYRQTQDFLREQLSGDIVPTKFAIFSDLKASGLSVAKAIDESFQSGLDRLATLLAKQFADDSSPEQARIVTQLLLADQLGLETAERLTLLEDGRYNVRAITAAAEMRVLSDEVQHALVTRHQDHSDAMVRFIRNPAAITAFLGELVHHPDERVGTALAHESSSRMRRQPDDPATQTLFNLMILRGSSHHVEILAPVAQSAEQLESLHRNAPPTPRVLLKFVENPNCSRTILCDVIETPLLKIQPGGRQLIEQAKKQIENRMSVETPSP